MDLASLKQTYEIQRELGRGGMGVVFQARDRRLDRHIALKILHLNVVQDNARSAQVTQRFLQEAKAIAKLNHPNIVTLYDMGECNGRYFLVMEYVDGYSLDVLHQKMPQISIDMVTRIGIQLCDALDYAHRQGIIHRDIKPANVLLNAEGKIKLMDFGIAQMQQQEEHRQTQAGEILGSVLYMSPEQLTDASQVDARSDVYSVGVTLYELLSKNLPFKGSNIGEVIRHILLSPPPSFASQEVMVPEAIAEIVYKALAKEPEQRFGSAAEMKEALLGSQLANMTETQADLELNALVQNIQIPIRSDLKAQAPEQVDVSDFIMQTLLEAEQEDSIL